MKNKFTIWYSDKVQREMDAGKPIELIDIDLKLSVLKSLHAKWLLDLYNHMTSQEGKKVIMKGWEVAGISGAVEKGIAGLPSLDPFDDIDPLSTTPFVIKSEINEFISVASEQQNMYVFESSA